MGICQNCGSECRTYRFEGQELCRDCLLDLIEEPQVIYDYLPAFVEEHKQEYIDWICDTSAGDPYQIEDYVERKKAQAVIEWKERHPDAYLESIHDFRTSKPGEWEDHFTEGIA